MEQQVRQYRAYHKAGDYLPRSDMLARLKKHGWSIEHSRVLIDSAMKTQLAITGSFGGTCTVPLPGSQENHMAALDDIYFVIGEYYRYFIGIEGNC